MDASCHPQNYHRLCGRDSCLGFCRVNLLYVILQLAHAATHIDVALWAAPFFTNDSHAKTIHADIAYTGYRRCGNVPNFKGGETESPRYP